MIQQDFADLHNHTSEALTAAWKLLWSLIIAIFHYLYQGSIWMRNLVEPQAAPSWTDVHPVKYESTSPVAECLNIYKYVQSTDGMLELQNETILSDTPTYIGMFIRET